MKGTAALWEIIRRLLDGERISQTKYREEAGISRNTARKRFDIISTLPGLELVRDNQGRYVLKRFVSDDEILDER